MKHESDGAIMHWLSRDLQCRICGYQYKNEYGEDAYCESCGSEQFDILDEYYERGE